LLVQFFLLVEFFYFVVESMDRRLHPQSKYLQLSTTSRASPLDNVTPRNDNARHEISQESGYPCFDYMKGAVWKYPSNYPVRDYQLNICKECLFKNTLVALPTGLGKTLIASVVMFNYYEWFPYGIVIFMAPTRPLVTQQIRACHSVVGIPESDCAHIEGSVSVKCRDAVWKEKRVVFCTPQTLNNDLNAGRIDPKRIVCIVVDEAHRATANYAYTSVVSSVVAH
jgi:ERCC4-related helicase